MDKRTKEYRDKNPRESQRRERVGFGGHRTRLQLSPKERKAMDDDGYIPYVFNGHDEVQEALAAGYVHCKPEECLSWGGSELHQGNSDLGSGVSKIVSRSGPEVRGWLMKTRKEFYEEDAASREARNAQIDQALKDPGGAKVENVYVPDGGGVSITRD